MLVLVAAQEENKCRVFRNRVVNSIAHTMKQLGKISKISVGQGGYQDAMIGITFDIQGQGWGIGDFWGYWATKITSGTKWTEADRIKALGEVMMRLNALLQTAKVSNTNQLVGIPVEVETKDNTLVSWRVLTEVL